MSLISLPGVSFTGVATVGRDASYPNWTRPSYLGYEHISVTSITMNALEVEATTGEAPFALFASAKNVTCSATRDNSVGSVLPYLHLEHKWTLTYNDDSAVTVESGDTLTNARGGSTNPYTDHVGGEYTVPIRLPGTYKLTLTSRGPNGSGGFVTGTQTATITVSASTLGHAWYDGLNGLNGNDGFDPWGFDTSTASYTESTGVLSQTNAFTNYDHTAATSGNPTDWYNYIYLTSADSGALGTWHRIASKTDNSNIVLEDKVGSDQTNVVSSDGAKQTFVGDETAAANEDVWIHLRGNQGATTYTFTERFRLSNGTYDNTISKYIGGYDAGTGGTDITTSTTISNALISTINAGFPEHAVVHNLDIDCNYNAQHAIGDTLTVGTQTTVRNMFVDRCQGANPAGDMCNDYSGTDFDLNLLFWGGTYTSFRETTEAKKHTMFVKLGDVSRLSIVGGTWSCYADSATLDHYIYPKGDNDNRLFAYNRMTGGLNNVAAAFNIDYSGGGTVNYVTVVENYADACQYLCDTSGTASDYTTDGIIGNILIARNAHDFTGCVDNSNRGALHTPNAGGREVCYLDNVSYHSDGDTTSSTSGGMATVGKLRDVSGTDIVVSRNLVYRDDATATSHGVWHDVGGTTNNMAVELTDNTGHILSSDVRQIDWNFDYTTNWVVDGNIFYSPNDASDFFDRGTGSVDTLAEVNSLITGTNTSSDPGWTDPANGDFT